MRRLFRDKSIFICFRLEWSGVTTRTGCNSNSNDIIKIRLAHCSYKR